MGWGSNEMRFFVEETYSFDRGSSKTSIAIGAHQFNPSKPRYFKPCSTRLFAVKSSLPTVTRTGSRWNVLASCLTESGQVALTDIVHERET